MKKLTMKQALVALVAGGFFTVACAGEDQFTKLDANADGYISAEESVVSEQLYQAWSATDANDDGKIDAAEFSAFEVNSTKSK
ncbi:MAG: EF-hand domain-containing protein [Candidatus Thiodiazotropha sp. (ex Lucinoma annulata)]|nr:EF-hand domain-containing protein [Candidatus Thiodiazotropha sp. (ex Lucinoma borealis)]MCU7838377.1 EF-hand domain-containing protein [Candidatus Thiodiazotropha sp. (ex Troendleina suluensis)]MCU7882924.1 EF-hand domain-containing protein [Candidatus Thiodiazotropha sp. (ex Lucinoma annulata)]MCU7856120.1 EF-hand domain-containing protein [Candidatus Thiodiazotropha sp. (ex Lucinoma borealis)]MCU7863167.1 EF-hand domain-containing protein [Candidatus Thiodiazotropha sp. (ex Lucinoma borea